MDSEYIIVAELKKICESQNISMKIGWAEKHKP